MFQKIKDFFAKLFGMSEVEESADYPIAVADNQNVQRRVGAEDMAKINIVEPRVYTEVEGIASLLLDKEAVLLNLRRVDEAQARRIIDYMAGIAYAVGGDVQKLSSEIFLCTPANIEIEGLLNETSQDSHMDFLESI